MQLIGKSLGQYRIVEQIGQGGMATVFKAYQASLDRYVAIKVLSAQHAQSPAFKDRFFREARSVARLSHPNILPIYDVGMEEDLSFIVMKFVSGLTVGSIMGQEMELFRICRLIDQIAGALDHAHNSGIVHRDIKPANLLLEDDWVFLSDFGIAKIMEASVVLTNTGELLGTPAYMSPEQASGKPTDHRTDIYSLGIVLYQMVTGHVPFEGETPYGVIFRHIHDPLPLPRGHRPELPESVERVLLKALAKDPNDRYDRAGKLAEALKAAVERSSDQPLLEPVSVPIDLQITFQSQNRISHSQDPQPIPDGSEQPRPVPVPHSPRTNHTGALIIAVLLLGILGTIIAFLYTGWRSPFQRADSDQSQLVTSARTQSVSSWRIDSSPRAAQVYVDGVSKGQTPASLYLPVGEHRVRLELPGYEPWEESIQLDDAEEDPFLVHLTKLAPVLEAKPKAEDSSGTVFVKPAGAMLPTGLRLDLDKRAVIDDPDGYSNVRGTKSAEGDNIIAKIYAGEEFYTSNQSGNWWLVQKKDGTQGYMHKSRIRIVGNR